MSLEAQVPGDEFVNLTDGVSMEAQVPGGDFICDVPGSSLGGAGSAIAPMYFLAT